DDAILHRHHVAHAPQNIVRIVSVRCGHHGLPPRKPVVPCRILRPSRLGGADGRRVVGVRSAAVLCADCTIVPIIGEGFLLDDRLPVSARVRWRGRPMDVSGRLTPGFIVENQRVMVKLTHVSPPPEGADGPELWIAATDVTSPRRLPLRSHLWELPAGQEREFVLRKLSIAVADCVAAGGRQVQLAREIPGTTALLFDVDVPLHDATSYLWNFAAAAGYCRGRSVPWQPAGPVTARAELDD